MGERQPAAWLSRRSLQRQQHLPALGRASGCCARQRCMRSTTSWGQSSGARGSRCWPRIVTGVPVVSSVSSTPRLRQGGATGVGSGPRQQPAAPYACKACAAWTCRVRLIAPAAGRCRHQRPPCSAAPSAARGLCRGGRGRGARRASAESPPQGVTQRRRRQQRREEAASPKAPAASHLQSTG